MIDLSEVEMICADPNDIQEYESLTRQIDSVNNIKELIPLLKRRATVMSHILGAPLRLFEEKS